MNGIITTKKVIGIIMVGFAAAIVANLPEKMVLGVILGLVIYTMAQVMNIQDKRRE